MSMKRTWLPLGAMALAGAAILAACGGDDSATITPVPTSTKGAAPTSTKAAAVSPAATTKGPIKLENPTVTASGLQYTDQVVGTGASPRMDQQVTVHYTGKLASNGTVFDSSVQRGQPAKFGMNGVIKGFSEGLSTMKVGGKRTVFIPSALGYGSSANGPIPANSDLIFEIELIAIK